MAPSAPPIRIGYARCSAKDQELDSRLIALPAAGCTRVFSEKISTRVKVRPELEGALALCWDIKAAASGQAVIFTVHELKRPARNAAELMPLLTFALALRAKGVGVPEIAAKLKMSSGKNAGRPPSVASLYRALAEADQRLAAVAPSESSASWPGRGRSRWRWSPVEGRRRVSRCRP
ncbi:recombinase family protein [Actinomadura yumaensis]|uniref:recombinase family protein n=1 Tax=Actinomadura yumaensis TaxID=111807 RepID=UPI00361EB408